MKFLVILALLTGGAYSYYDLYQQKEHAYQPKATHDVLKSVHPKINNTCLSLSGSNMHSWEYSDCMARANQFLPICHTRISNALPKKIQSKQEEKNAMDRMLSCVAPQSNS